MTQVEYRTHIAKCYSRNFDGPFYITNVDQRDIQPGILDAVQSAKTICEASKADAHVELATRRRLITMKYDATYQRAQLTFAPGIDAELIATQCQGEYQDALAVVAADEAAMTAARDHMAKTNTPDPLFDDDDAETTAAMLEAATPSIALWLRRPHLGDTCAWVTKRAAA